MNYCKSKAATELQLKSRDIALKSIQIISLSLMTFIMNSINFNKKNNQKLFYKFLIPFQTFNNVY